MLDLTSLAYQPKSRERSAHPKRHVTSALSEQKLAYPADTRELDEDEVDKPRVRPDRIAISEKKDDKLLVQPTSRKEPVEEQRESAAARKISCTVTKKRRTSIQSAEIHLPHWNKRCQESRVSDQRMPQIWAKRQKLKLSATLSTVCLPSVT